MVAPRSLAKVLPLTVVAVVATVLAVVLAVGDRDGDGRVRIEFRPPVGAEFAYRTEVTSTTTTDLPCQPPETRTDRTQLDAHQLVLEPDGPVARVQVAITREGIGSRTFVMRFDRAAQLTAVEQVEGIPAAALGDLGLSEIFPAAAGAPPDTPLTPGDRWAIDEEVQLGAGEPTPLQGEGRLVGLGAVDGHDTATVASRTELGVSTRTEASTGTRTLTGSQRSELRAVYDLDTGAVRHAEAETVGRYRVELGPPPGGTGDPCIGTLTVTLRSTVDRAD